MKIYLASSWRNDLQPGVLKLLRDAGQDVYDFRNPTTSDQGFQWRQVALVRPPSVENFRQALAHPCAVKSFQYDAGALAEADACVLLLPCGRSAHLEAGWAAGAGKLVIVYTHDGEEPELMYKWAHDVVGSDAELVAAVAKWNLVSR